MRDRGDPAELDLLPANGILAGAEVELAGMRRREFRLREALAEGREQYAAVIIDCPPSLGLLTINALTAASAVVIPIQCEYLALEGLMQLVDTLDLVRRRLNPALDVLGVVMTMFDARTRLSPQVVNDVRRFFPSRLLQTVIPRAVRLAEAPSYGQTIFEYDGASRAAHAYGEVGAEIARRIDLPSAAGRPRRPLARTPRGSCHEPGAVGTSGGWLELVRPGMGLRAARRQSKMLRRPRGNSATFGWKGGER